MKSFGFIHGVLSVSAPPETARLNLRSRLVCGILRTTSIRTQDEPDFCSGTLVWLSLFRLYASFSSLNAELLFYHTHKYHKHAFTSSNHFLQKICTEFWIIINHRKNISSTISLFLDKNLAAADKLLFGGLGLEFVVCPCVTHRGACQEARGKHA